MDFKQNNRILARRKIMIPEGKSSFISSPAYKMNCYKQLDLISILLNVKDITLL